MWEHETGAATPLLFPAQSWRGVGEWRMPGLGVWGAWGTAAAQRREPRKRGGCVYLDGLGVMLQPLVDLGDGQDWLGPLHTVTGGGG